MERFVYIGLAGSRDSALIDRKANGLVSRSLDNICNKIIIYANSIIYFTNSNLCDGVYDNMIENLNDWNNWINNLTSFINNTLRTNANWNNDDLIYVSIHPGGGNRQDIKAKLLEINKKLKEDKANIKITYHGSKCITDWNEIKTIDNLNNKVKLFIEPNMEAEMHDNNEIVLLQKALLDELFVEGDSINEGLLKSAFDIKNFEDNKDEIIKTIKEYRNSLDKTNKIYNDYIKIIENNP